jgi:hypothetical protein
VGVTYIAYSKTEWGNYAWKYIKLVSDTRILSVNDEAHHPKSYYYQRDSDGEAYLKALVVNECMYEIKSRDYYSTLGIATQLFLKLKNMWKRVLVVTTPIGKESGEVLVRWSSKMAAIVLTQSDWSYPGNLYKAKIQLPNSLDEYVS